MKFSVNSKGLELSPAQDFIIQKGLDKINRFCKNFNPDLVTAQVIISYHNPPKLFAAHISLEVPGNNLAAVTNDPKFSLAYNKAVTKILTQLRKHKSKLKNEREFAQVAQSKGKL